jgi:hypothetical protein
MIPEWQNYLPMLPSHVKKNAAAIWCAGRKGQSLMSILWRPKYLAKRSGGGITPAESVNISAG